MSSAPFNIASLRQQFSKLSNKEFENALQAIQHANSPEARAATAKNRQIRTQQHQEKLNSIQSLPNSKRAKLSAEPSAKNQSAVDQKRLNIIVRNMIASTPFTRKYEPTIVKNTSAKNSVVSDEDYEKGTRLLYKGMNSNGQHYFQCLGRPKKVGTGFTDGGLFPKGSIVAITDGNFPKDKKYKINDGINDIDVVVVSNDLQYSNCSTLITGKCAITVDHVLQGGRRRRRTKRRHRVKRSTRRR